MNHVQDLIDLGLLLPTNQAINTPQRIVVDGVIFFDKSYIFALGSEIVLKTACRLIVNNGTLTILGTHIHGCQNLWDYISVKNATLVIHDSNIEQGIDAILLEDQSRIEAVNNIFSANSLSIKAGNLNTASPSTIAPFGRGIVENHFIGDGSYQNLVGQQVFPTVRAIVADNVFHFRVGVEQFGNSIPIIEDNHFINFNQSSNPLPIITANNSSLTVENSFFVNCNWIGIYGSDYDATPSRLTFRGHGNDFVNVKYPILTLGINTTIVGAGFEGGERQIDLRPINKLYQNKFIITDNFFNAFTQAGIHAIDVFPNAESYFKRNTFSDNSNLPPVDDPNTPEIDPRRGIFLSSITPNQTARVKIDSNVFENHLKTGSSQFNHIDIHLRNVSGLKQVDDKSSYLDNNTMVNWHHSSNDYTYNGIFLENAKYFRLRTNNSTGLTNYSAATPGTKTIGINTEQSGSNYFNCNYFYYLKNGMRFNGQFCDKSEVKNNWFYYHGNDLRLENGTIIGKQKDKRNQWSPQSNSSILEANFNIPASDPGLLVLPIVSQFEVKVLEDINANYWPQLRYPAGNSWFIYKQPLATENPFESICEVQPSGLKGEFSEAEEWTLRGEFPALFGEEGTIWDANFRLYGTLWGNDSLRPVDSDAAIFFEEKSEAALGKLYAIYDGISHLGEGTPSGSAAREANYNRTVELLDFLEATDRQMSITTDDNLLKNIMVIQDSLSELLKIIQLEGGTINEGENTFFENQVDGLIGQLDNIQSVERTEINMKTVLEVFLDMYNQPEVLKLNENHRSILLEIASECAYSGGYAVLLARFALGRSDFDDAVLCGSERPAASNRSRTDNNSFGLFPNPTTDGFTIVRNNPAENETLSILSTTGQELLIINLSDKENSTFVSTIGLLPGIYFVSNYSNGKLRSTHKLTILH